MSVTVPSTIRQSPTRNVCLSVCPSLLWSVVVDRLWFSLVPGNPESEPQTTDPRSSVGENFDYSVGVFRY